MRHTRYIAYAKPSTLQALADRLNAPRSYSEDYTESDGPLGLGPGTAREDASSYQGVDEKPEGPPSRRMLTLSVAPHDRSRFEAICEDAPGVRFDTYHPTGADGSKWKHPIDFPQDNGLERLPDQAGGPQ